MAAGSELDEFVDTLDFVRANDHQLGAPLAAGQPIDPVLPDEGMHRADHRDYTTGPLSEVVRNDWSP